MPQLSAGPLAGVLKKLMTTFSFTQEYIQNQQRRQKIGSVILGSTILFLLIVFYLFNPLKSFDVSVQWFFPIVILFTLLFSIYVYNKNIRLFLSTVIELDENKISAINLDSTHKVILREEIKQIVELRGNGLRIDRINSDLSIYLPTELQNYEQLKTNLSKWSPFVSQSDPLIKL